MRSSDGTSYIVDEAEICELKTRLTAVLTDLELARRRLVEARDGAELLARRSDLVELNADALASAERACAVLKRPPAGPPRAPLRQRTKPPTVLFSRAFRSGV